MMLLIDAGNSRLKWGLRENGRWVGQGVLDYDALDTLPTLWSHAPARCLIANVAGRAQGERLVALLAQHGVAAHFLRASREAGGVTNHYRDPAQLGVDRWAALIGARGLHQGAALVVCAGTATTIDVLDDKGIFQGGCILPGLDLMKQSLAAGTANLPLAEADFQALPRSTDEAIVAGCLAAQAGAIAQLWPQVENLPGAVVILSGGAASLIAPRLACPLREIPNLVLEGLARLAEGQRSVGEAH